MTANDLIIIKAKVTTLDRQNPAGRGLHKRYGQSARR